MKHMASVVLFLFFLLIVCVFFFAPSVDELSKQDKYAMPGYYCLDSSVGTRVLVERHIHNGKQRALFSDGHARYIDPSQFYLCKK